MNITFGFKKPQGIRRNLFATLHAKESALDWLRIAAITVIASLYVDVFLQRTLYLVSKVLGFIGFGHA